MNFARCIIFLIALWAVQHLSGQSIHLNTDFGHTNGTVKAIVEDTANNMVIVAGDFDKVFPSIPFGTLVDPESGEVHDHLPVPNGPVHVAVQDQLGGWYLAGDFTAVDNTTRNRMAYITPDAELGSWAAETNGTVNSIAIAGDTVFIAGNFTMVNQENCRQLAALDASTGALLDYRGNFSHATGTPNIKHIEVYENKLFAGGYFDKLHDAGKHGVRLSPLDPEKVLPTDLPNNLVKIAVEDGQGGWIIQGTFTQVGDSLRNGFAHIDAGGRVSAWTVETNASITSMYSRGNTLYIGGTFNRINGHNRTRLAAFNIDNQSITEWDPRVSVAVDAITADDEAVYLAGIGGYTGNFGGLANVLNTADPEEVVTKVFPNIQWPGIITNSIADGNGGWYVMGGFTYYGGQPRRTIAHLDADGELTDFSISTFGKVHAAVLLGDTLLIGGDFETINGEERLNLAMVNRHTGELLDWSLACDGVVRALELHNNLLYMTGTFRTLGDVPRRGAAALHRSTASLSLWNPGVGGIPNILKIIDDHAYISGTFINYAGNFADNGSPVHTQNADNLYMELRPNGPVRSAASDGNGGWYIGGDFTKVSTETRNRLAHIDNNGQLGDFDPGLTTINSLNSPRAMAFADGMLYVYGGGPIDGMFTGLYAVDVNTSQIVWSATINGAVKDITVVEDKVYIAGDFTGVVQTNNRNGLAAVNRFTGAVLPWNPEANDESHAIHALGDKLYVAGSFTQIGGVARNKSASLDLITAEPGIWNPNFYDIFDFESTGDTLIAAGNFSFSDGMGGLRRVVAYDHNTGERFTNWGPSLPFGSTMVSHLAKIGNTLFMGGNFEEVNGEPRKGVAKINIPNSALLPWSTSIDGDLVVLAAAQEIVYIGGDLNRIGGTDRHKIVQFDLETGALGDFNPYFDYFGGFAHVRAIHHSGPRIIVGGHFSHADGVAASHLAVFDRYTLEAIPSGYGQINGGIHAINNIGSDLYIGGEFTSVSGQTRTRIAAIHPLTGALNPYIIWSNDLVRHINTQSTYLFVSGDFTRLGGKQFSYTAAVDASTARRTAWDPEVSGIVSGFAISENGIYLGGSFAVAGGEPRIAIAKVTKDTGALLPFNPTLSGPGLKKVEAIELFGDEAVVFHGNFTGVNGENRSGVASVSPINSAVHSLDIEVSIFEDAPTIRAFGQHNNQLVLGGNFTAVDGINRSKIAMVDPITGALSDWQVDVENNSGEVYCLSANDSMMYVGGNFARMGGRPGGGIAALNLDDLQLSTWNANMLNCDVNDFAIDDGKIYMGLVGPGSLSNATIGGEERTKLAAVDAATASLLPWAPTIPGGVGFEHLDAENGVIYVSGFNPGGPSTYLGSWLSDGTPRDWASTTSGRIYDLKLRSNGVFIAGSFGNIDGLIHYRLARLDTETGIPHADWNPGPNKPVTCIGNGSEDLYIGGEFNGFGFVERDNVAAFDLQTGDLLDFAPSIGGSVNDMFIHDNKLYFAGSLVSLNGEPRHHIAAVSLADGSNEAINIIANSGVGKTAVHNDDLYVSGNFTILNGIPASRLGKIDLNTGLVQAWNYDIDGTVLDLAVHNGSLYFCGQFNTVTGLDREHFAAINLNTNQLTPWNPGCDGYATTLAVDGSSLYAGGPFDMVGNEARPGLARFDLPSGNLNSWTPAIEGSSTKSFTFNDNLIFLGGYYGSNEGIFAFDQASTEINDWVPELNNVVWKVLASGNRLYAGGAFNYWTGPHSGFAVYELGSCSDDPICQDLTVELSDEGFYTLQFEDLLFDNTTLCLPYTGSMSQIDFSCDEAGLQSLSANLLFVNGTNTTCNFTVNVLTPDDEDDDGDGIVNFCDFCFGDNSTGDSNGNGICDDSEIVGCMDPGAPNYNPLATTPGFCTVAVQYPNFPGLPEVPDDPDDPDEPDDPSDPNEPDSPAPPFGLQPHPNTNEPWTFRVFPNPANGKSAINMEFQDLPVSTDPIRIAITDLTGRSLYNENFTLTMTRSLIRIEPNIQFTMGYYLITVYTRSGTKTQRLLIH